VLGAGARAKARATRASMETIKGALSQYNMEHSIYPPTLDTLKTGGFLEKGKPLKDGWGRDFVYNPQGRDKDRPFILGSSGENGQTGDEDDIDVWTMHEKNN
jgi:type II secretory pathway pseudopilin PulG